MKISFSINGTHYEGTAVPFEKPGVAETQFVVRLENRELPVFHVYWSGEKWVSEDMPSADLVAAAGSGIEKNNDGSLDLKAQGAAAGETAVNGEIRNEPEDVDEHAFDNLQNTQS